MRGELEGAVEGIGDGEKISWEERGQLPLTQPPHTPQTEGAAEQLPRARVSWDQAYPKRLQRSISFLAVKFFGGEMEKQGSSV